ncbi:hypothetical protein BDQ17DRAFT_1374987 [Cyathus striatus]|nr:hypothetical protein BDQ17DRAFT_1374987 [Cyathus striatus]
MLVLVLLYYLCIRRRVRVGEKEQWETAYSLPTQRELPYTRQMSYYDAESEGRAGRRESQVALALAVPAGAYAYTDETNNNNTNVPETSHARTSLGGQSIGMRSRFASIDLMANYPDTEAVSDDRSEVLPRYPSEISSLYDEKEDELSGEGMGTGPYSGFTTQRMAELHEERMRMKDLIEFMKARPQ